MESLEGNIGGRKGRNVINQTEVSLVRIILSGLFSSGVRPTSVGIITPFRAQVSEGNNNVNSFLSNQSHPFYHFPAKSTWRRRQD